MPLYANNSTVKFYGQLGELKPVNAPSFSLSAPFFVRMPAFLRWTPTHASATQTNRWSACSFLHLPHTSAQSDDCYATPTTMICLNDDDNEPLDINHMGVSYFDLIDEENKRHRRVMQRLQQAMATERQRHEEHLGIIGQQFDIKTQRPATTTPTRQTKEQIRNRVRRWSQTLPSYR